MADRATAFPSIYRLPHWKKLDLEHLERIGLVAIGRAFSADLCIAEVRLYRVRADSAGR